MFFATILDKNYITRASLMIESLSNQMKSDLKCMFVICLDDVVFKTFHENKIIQTIPIAKIEETYPELLIAKKNREYAAYIFTLSAFYPLYILTHFAEIKRVTTLDSDLFFFKNPLQTLQQLGDSKIGITKHDFTNELKHLEIYGKYNVSFQSFPKTDEGLLCLKSWANDCIDFCKDELDEQGRFADQKYLDAWEKKYSNVKEFPSPIVGLAPWNIGKYKIKWLNETICCDKGDPIFYHFHNIRVRSKYHLMHGLKSFGHNKIHNDILKLYFFYWRKLVEVGHHSDKNIKRYSNRRLLNIRWFLVDIMIGPILLKWKSIEISFDFYKPINTILSLFRK